jgi:hypothetical protein
VSAGAEHGDDRRERDQRDTGPGQGRAPAACQPGGKNNRCRFDTLDGGGEKYGDEEEGIAAHGIGLHDIGQ